MTKEKKLEIFSFAILSTYKYCKQTYKSKVYLMASNHLSVTVCKKILFAWINNQDVHNKYKVQLQKTERRLVDDFLSTHTIETNLSLKRPEKGKINVTGTVKIVPSFSTTEVPFPKKKRIQKLSRKKNQKRTPQFLVEARRSNWVIFTENTANT